MQLRLEEFGTWVLQATRNFEVNGLPPLDVPLKGGEKMVIAPSVSVHEGLTVLGGDWIPVRADGVATVEQMLHSPALYLQAQKGHVKKAGDGRWLCDIDTVDDVPGDALLLGGTTNGSTNYYHWLVDSLPRLLLARSCMPVAGLRVIVSEKLARFQADSLALLGIAPESLLPVREDQAVRARSTVVPSLLSAITVTHPAVPGMLRGAFPARPGARGGERIYLSRQDAAVRKLTNEPELTALLERHGFERHVPGAMGFQEQVDLMANAKVIVAVHGAGMSNMIFCPPGATVIEIFSPLHQATFMSRLAKVCGHRHQFVQARTVSFGADGNPMNGTWQAYLKPMEAVLEAL